MKWSRFSVAGRLRPSAAIACLMQATIPSRGSVRVPSRSKKICFTTQGPCQLALVVERPALIAVPL
jgi:hypothetical protein